MHSLIINRETLILPLAILITLAGGIFGHHPLKAGMELLFSLYAGSGSGNHVPKGRISQYSPWRELSDEHTVGKSMMMERKCL